MKRLQLLAAACVMTVGMAAQTDSTKVGSKSWLPHVSGTIRGKVEYQTNEKESRFEVRTARVALDGFITPMVDYKAEIDLSDEGQIKMLDAYAACCLARGSTCASDRCVCPSALMRTARRTNSILPTALS